MLDERGQDIGSEQMAELVGGASNTVRKPCKLSLPYMKILQAWAYEY